LFSTFTPSVTLAGQISCWVVLFLCRYATSMIFCRRAWRLYSYIGKDTGRTGNFHLKRTPGQRVDGMFPFNCLRFGCCSSSNDQFDKYLSPFLRYQGGLLVAGPGINNISYIHKVNKPSPL
jgi:hypothetical protein